MRETAICGDCDGYRVEETDDGETLPCCTCGGAGEVDREEDDDARD